MTVYFVSRHQGAHIWARYHNNRKLLPHVINAFVEDVDAETAKRGDVVMGTLPLAKVARLRERGVRFFGLDLQIPRERRGHELSATEMYALRATLTQYRVLEGDSHDIEPLRRVAAPKSKPAITVMLVSRELSPQIIGLKHVPTPSVVLITTDAMHESGQQLRNVLSEAGVKGIETIEVVADSYAAWLIHARDSLNGLADKGHEIIYVNCTGGTKIMSSAFVEAAREAAATGVSIRAYYVDPDHRQIDWFGRHPAQELKSCTNIKDALACQSVEVKGAYSASDAFDREALRDDVHGMLLKSSAILIGELNAVFSACDGLLRGGRDRVKVASERVDSTVSDPATGHFRIRVGDELLGQLCGDLGLALSSAGCLRSVPETQSESGWLDLYLGDGTRQRAIEETAYLSGRWFEVHVGSLLKECGADDWAVGLQIDRGTENELDGVAVCGNQLLVLEVKTSNQSRKSEQGGRNSVAANALYKADSIGEKLARYFGKRWYVSLRPLDNADLDRGSRLNITVFAPAAKGQVDHPARKSLGKLPGALRAWVNVCQLEKVESFKPAVIADVHKNAFQMRKSKPIGSKSGRKDEGEEPERNASGSVPRTKTSFSRGATGGAFGKERGHPAKPTIAVPNAAPKAYKKQLAVAERNQEELARLKAMLAVEPGSAEDNVA